MIDRSGRVLMSSRGALGALLLVSMASGCKQEERASNRPEKTRLAGLAVEGEALPVAAPVVPDAGVAAGRVCGVKPLPSATAMRIDKQVESAKRAGFQPRGVGQVTIDAYVHVITTDDGAFGDVPDSVIDEQIKRLNRAYEASPFLFRFSPKQIDRTPATTWYYLERGSPEEADMKRYLREGDAGALNLYIVSPLDALLGWATYPWDFTQATRDLDGVVVAVDSLPGGAAPFNEGDTAVHEVGHWLGLLHTFEGGCDGRGDLVADTPAEAQPARGCQHADTCPDPLPDPTDNFMDYSDDPCMTQFTAGQLARMDEQHATYRKPRTRRGPQLVSP
jgi:hypothetical protein